MSNLDLSRHVILDCSSGTFFNASRAVVVDTNALTPGQLETLNEGSDSDRAELVWDGLELLPFAEDLEHWSRPSDRQALDAVAALLNAEQWSSDHIQAVAEIIRGTGREVNDA